ncbi:MAG: hypothetical protein WC850_04190 [Candidatus Gracilibacteria bacterium]
METYEPSRIKLNTIEFENGLNPNGKIEDFCDITIDGKVLDRNIEDFFSIQSKKIAFGKKYKDNNQIETTNSDGKITKKNIPTIINGGMGKNVSSPSLVEGMNEIGFGGHISSIDVGFFYYYKKYPDLFNEDFTWKSELKEKVKKDFDELFKGELGLSDEFINKHFFVCDDLGENDKNEGFNGELGNEKIARMMDLIVIYKETTRLKKEGNNVGINCMYKTSSYIASLKISILAGMDYITTAAGNPTMNPKEFLKEFFDDLKESNKEFSLPAFGLLVSGGRSKVFTDFDYDYYTFEQGDKAGGHIIRMGDKFEELEKIKGLFEKKGKVMPPIYAAGGVSTNKEIKEAFEAGFSGIQIGTIPAVSEEACDGDGEVFKKRLIGGNHLGEETDLDREFFAEGEDVLKKFEKIIEKYNGLILRNLSKETGIDYKEETPEIANVRDYLYKIIYNDFFDEEIKNLEDLSEEELKNYNQIKAFIFTSKNGDIKKINKVLRNYGNAKKFVKEFNKFKEENDSSPTHIVFDSTVGFPGRMKIMENIHEVIAGEVKSNGCINCLTDCILAGRGNIREDRGSTFCIKDRLNYLNPDKNIAFSGRSTVPYPEIRPIMDGMAYLMGTYVKR